MNEQKKHSQQTYSGEISFSSYEHESAKRDKTHTHTRREWVRKKGTDLKVNIIQMKNAFELAASIAHHLFHFLSVFLHTHNGCKPKHHDIAISISLAKQCI